MNKQPGYHRDYANFHYPHARYQETMMHYLQINTYTVVEKEMRHKGKFMRHDSSCACMVVEKAHLRLTLNSKKIYFLALSISFVCMYQL